LRDFLITKDTDPLFLEDLNYTLEKLAEAPECLVKLPQFSIYFSLKLFKRMLKESKIIDAKSDPVTALLVRKRLNVESDLYLDEMIKFIGYLEWCKCGYYPSNHFYNHKLLNLEEMPFPRFGNDTEYPYRFPSKSDILRLLLKEFLGTVEYVVNVVKMKDASKNEGKQNVRVTDFLFINECLPEKEFYFGRVPVNFLKYLILSLNHTNLKLNDEVSNADHRNLDLSLVLSYNENHKYEMKPENLLYKVWLSDKSDVRVCWSTLRPQSVFKNMLPWSAYCPNLDKKYRHRARLQKCDSLHLSFYKLYLECFLEIGGIPNENEFLRFLVKHFPFKTFYHEVLDGVRITTENLSKIMRAKYDSNYGEIKKVIEATINMRDRQEIEIRCEETRCRNHRYPRPTSDALRRARKKYV
jgi:hypothetical protein